MEFKVANCPSQELALTNCLFLSAKDHAMLGTDGDIYIELRGFVYTARASEKVEAGHIGMNSIQRRLVGVSLGDAVGAALFAPSGADGSMLSSASVEVDFVVRGKARGSESLDGGALSKQITERYGRQFLTNGQTFAIEFQGVNLLLKVGKLEAIVLDSSSGGSAGEAGVHRGMLVSQTQLVLAKAAGSALVLTGLESQGHNTIFKADFSFSDMGIGGLDKEFSDIFRRAFASRVFPAAVMKKLGVRHVKGMLLHGPPGTGKTLIARQIGKMLNGKEPKIVNGPEMLSKFVGQSEENIRNLFADADAEYAERGDDSELHIIIFDEIDSVCKQRGSTNNGTGVHDTVTSTGCPPASDRTKPHPSPNSSPNPSPNSSPDVPRRWSTSCSRRSTASTR